MYTFEIIALLALLCVASFQLWLTTKVVRSGLYERKQKMFQIQLIWLLPIVGAALVFSVLREDEAAQGGPHTHLRG